MGDTLACFSTDGHTQDVCKGCMHKAHNVRQQIHLHQEVQDRPCNPPYVHSHTKYLYEYQHKVSLKNRQNTESSFPSPSLCTPARARTAAQMWRATRTATKQCHQPMNVSSRRGAVMCCSLFPPSHSAERTSNKNGSWEKIKPSPASHCQQPTRKQQVSTLNPATQHRDLKTH